MKWRILIALAVVLLNGCASVQYYWQSARGQFEVQMARRPIAALLKNPDTPALLRQRLGDVQAMVRFADQELALPSQGSYRDYADLGRDVAVWTVVAAPRLSLTAKRWCYPVVGCLTYRGFFALVDAARFAQTLREQSDDVYVAPVRAYSTLGWFADPVLNTVINGPTWDLAGIIFHELSHQKLYLSGDTEFNEAYATTVQREGVRRWLARRKASHEQEQYRLANTRRVAITALVTHYRGKLDEVYRSQQDRTTKLRCRQQIFKAMRGAYADLKSQWQGFRGYDRWFGQDLNNAKLALVATYNDLVPGFNALLKLKHGDMSAFHSTVAQLAELTPALRRERLESWTVAAATLQRKP